MFTEFLERVFSVMTNPWMFLLGCLVTFLLCVAAAFFEKLKLNKFTLTIGDIIIYFMLTCFSWYGLIIATVVCLITNTTWLNKVIKRF